MWTQKALATVRAELEKTRAHLAAASDNSRGYWLEVADRERRLRNYLASREVRENR